MALDLENSPYAMSLPRSHPQEGLGYSRHYAQRIRDMGKSSKDSWIKRLWHHMFQGNKKNEPGSQPQSNQSKSDSSPKIQSRYPQKNGPGTSLPPISTNQKATSPQGSVSGAGASSAQQSSSKKEVTFGDTLRYSSDGTGGRGDGSRSAPIRGRDREQQQQTGANGKMIPAQLADSPYIPARERTNYRIEKKAHSSDRPKKSKESPFMRKPGSHPYLSQNREEWKPKLTRGVSMISLEKRAKSTAEKAMKLQSKINNAVFQRLYDQHLANSPYTNPLLNAQQQHQQQQHQQRLLHHSAPQPLQKSAPRTWKFMAPSMLYRQPPVTVPPAVLTTTGGGAAGGPNNNKNSSPQIWRPVVTKRAAETIELERRAYEFAEKAMKDGKIFTCEGPYPLDTYVRLSLRKRGWVEKFGPKVSGGVQKSTADKIECEDDEDFEAIMEHYIPAPWEEDHGIYLIMSRIVRHYPAKFIWGGRNVNSMVLRSEVIVNHFPKARYFSSKVGLSNSLRELPWLCSQDAHDFFPRCYTITDDEKDDIVEDFRLTTCMCMLKWVIKMYVAKSLTEDAEDANNAHNLQRENTKYEEVKFKEDGEEEESEENKEEGEESEEKTAETTEEQDADELESVETEKSGEEEKEKEKEEGGEKEEADQSAEKQDVDGDDKKEEAKEGNKEKKGKQGKPKPVKAKTPNRAYPELPEMPVCPRNHHFHDYEPVPTRPVSSPARVRRPKPVSAASTNRSQPVQPATARTPTKSGKTKATPQTPSVAPDLRRPKKKTTEIPGKAVDWCIGHLDRHLRSKNHEDLDTKSPRGLTVAQWDQLVAWFYQVSNENVNIPITEGKLRECEDVLKKMKKSWPQYELDGDRNVWIVKPGDKSKGVGIEFVNKLDDIMKYLRDTMSGTYVLQKYVERPLLVFKCKFDIRQWFLVTEWNPLTVWFYKESYLRICSQEFSYDTMHEAVHLSNVAVQQNYLNGRRNSRIPDDNFMPATDFKAMMAEEGEYCGWDDVTYPGMKDAIVNVLLATQDVSESRKCAFELYGADFILTEDYQPWLLEINSSPGMAPSSLAKAKLCAAVIEDTIKVVLDKRENRYSDTGNFELAFKDAPLPNTKCVETKFLLEGQRIRRGDLAKYNQIDQRMTRQENQRERKRERAERETPKEAAERSAENEKRAEDKDEAKEYKALDLYGKENNKENEESVYDSARETEKQKEKIMGKPPHSAIKREKTTANKSDNKGDKVEQILKQSPYNSSRLTNEKDKAKDKKAK